MYRLLQLAQHIKSHARPLGYSAATLCAVPIVYNAVLPPVKLFGLGGNQKSNDSNVDVEIDNNSITSVNRASSSSTNSTASAQSELDDLLGQLFGKDSSSFDPIDEISKNVPRALWPQFFTDLVEQHEHKRYNRNNTNTRSTYTGDDLDTSDQLLHWLSKLAPNHKNLWDWTTEIGKPFHLHLQDNGNEYQMRVSVKSMSKNDIKVRVNNNVLTVIGAKKASGDTYQSSAAMQQSIRLPPDADKNNLRAKFNESDNTLYISIPKYTSLNRNAEIKIE